MKHIKIKSKGLFTLLAMMFALPIGAATGDPAVDKNWYMTDGTFWILLVISLLLMYVIYALGEVVVWGAKKRAEDHKKSTSNLNSILILVGTIFITSQLPAQDAGAVAAPVKESIWSSPYLPLYILIFIEVCVISYLSLMLFQLTKREAAAKEVVVKAPAPKSWFSRTWEKWNYKVPVEREDEILLDEHDYDGIHELDNSLPPWLNYIFIITFVFAVIYFIFHFFNISPTQDELYVKSMEKADRQLAEYRAKSSDFYDENSVVLDNSEAVVSEGKKIFTEKCVACHGAAGEGGVGPNLTDDYWIHGGRINDLFKTVKYGVQEKGMVSWKDVLSPKQIFEVTNFIKSLHGTNPPNGKEPQGTIYVEGGTDSTAAPVDSMKVLSDTLTVAINN